MYSTQTSTSISNPISNCPAFPQKTRRFRFFPSVSFLSSFWSRKNIAPIKIFHMKCLHCQILSIHRCCLRLTEMPVNVAIAVIWKWICNYLRKRFAAMPGRASTLPGRGGELECKQHHGQNLVVQSGCQAVGVSSCKKKEGILGWGRESSRMKAQDTGLP